MPCRHPNLCLGLLFALALAQTAAAWAQPRIERIVLSSQILGEDRPLNIALPAAGAAGGTYPVVYMLDGGDRYLPDMAARMQAVHPNLLVVGVENVDRDRDMFPRPLPERDDRGGGGARFLDFLVRELVPYIEARHPANGFRVLTGQSNSGFFVLYALIHAPDTFDGYLAGSPMIGWDWEMLSRGFRELLDDRASFPKALFLNRGETDLDRCTEYLPLFVELLQEIAPEDFRWWHEVVLGDEHVPENTYEHGIAFLLEGR